MEFNNHEELHSGGVQFDGFTCEGDLRMLAALCPLSDEYYFGGQFEIKVPTGYFKIAFGQFYVFAKVEDKCRINEETRKDGLSEQKQAGTHSAHAEGTDSLMDHNVKIDGHQLQRILNHSKVKQVIVKCFGMKGKTMEWGHDWMLKARTADPASNIHFDVGSVIHRHRFRDYNSSHVTYWPTFLTNHPDTSI